MASPTAAIEDPVAWIRACFEWGIASAATSFSDEEVAQVIIDLIEITMRLRPSQHTVLIPQLLNIVHKFETATQAEEGDAAANKEPLTEPQSQFVTVNLLKKPISFNTYCASMPMDDPAELAAALEFDFQQLNVQKPSKKVEDEDHESNTDNENGANDQSNSDGTASVKSKPITSTPNLRRRVTGMAEVMSVINTYLTNNPRKDKDSVINAVVLMFRQYQDRLVHSENKLADSGFARFTTALEFALNAYDPVQFAKVAYQTLQAFATMHGKNKGLVLTMDFMKANRQELELVQYNVDGIDLPAVTHALKKLRHTRDVDRVVQMLWAMDCRHLAHSYDATVVQLQRDMALVKEHKAYGVMARQLPRLTKIAPGRHLTAVVTDLLVNVNLTPGQSHDEYAAAETRSCLREARDVGRAVDVIVQARGRDEIFENPGLIFAWLLNDKGANRMHAAKVQATARAALQIILDHVATDPLFDGESMRACHQQLYKITATRINKKGAEPPLPIEQSLSLLRSTISSPAHLYAALTPSARGPDSRLVEVRDTPKKLRETGEEFRAHQGGLIYPQSSAQSPMPKVPTTAERNAAMHEEDEMDGDSDDLLNKDSEKIEK